jgi:hypothetical protein
MISFCLSVFDMSACDVKCLLLCSSWRIDLRLHGDVWLLTCTPAFGCSRVPLRLKKPLYLSHLKRNIFKLSRCIRDFPTPSFFLFTDPLLFEISSPYIHLFMIASSLALQFITCRRHSRVAIYSFTIWQALQAVYFWASFRQSYSLPFSSTPPWLWRLPRTGQNAIELVVCHFLGLEVPNRLEPFNPGLVTVEGSTLVQAKALLSQLRSLQSFNQWVDVNIKYYVYWEVILMILFISRIRTRESNDSCSRKMYIHKNLLIGRLISKKVVDHSGTALRQKRVNLIWYRAKCWNGLPLIFCALSPCARPCCVRCCPSSRAELPADRPLCKWCALLSPFIIALSLSRRSCQCHHEHSGRPPKKEMWEEIQCILFWSSVSPVSFLPFCTQRSSVLTEMVKTVSPENKKVQLSYFPFYSPCLYKTNETFTHFHRKKNCWKYKIAVWKF